MKKSIVAFVLLIVTALMSSCCFPVPVPVGDGGGHRGGGHNDGGGSHRDGGGGGHRDGGDRR